MTMKQPQQEMTEVHHALIFACIARAAVKSAGEEMAGAALRKAVRIYGEQRGGRMALRAKANGHALNMGNYLAYCEYKISPGGMQQAIVEKVPHVRTYVSRCPWHTTWKENDLLPYGRFYCQVIDEAVVRGFNPALKIDVRGTQTNGGERCEFVFHDANLNLFTTLSIGYKKAIKPGSKAVMPWSYHAGHLFATLEKVLVEELGPMGQSAVETGLADFSARCGAQAVETIIAGREINYAVVPQQSQDGGI